MSERFARVILSLLFLAPLSIYFNPHHSLFFWFGKPQTLEIHLPFTTHTHSAFQRCIETLDHDTLRLSLRKSTLDHFHCFSIIPPLFVSCDSIILYYLDLHNVSERSTERSTEWYLCRFWSPISIRCNHHYSLCFDPLTLISCYFLRLPQCHIFSIWKLLAEAWSWYIKSLFSKTRIQVTVTNTASFFSRIPHVWCLLAVYLSLPFRAVHQSNTGEDAVTFWPSDPQLLPPTTYHLPPSIIHTESAY